jgi:hypothetical protein
VGLNQVAQPRTLPILLHHEILRFREALYTCAKLLGKLVYAFRFASSLEHHALYDSKMILRPMSKLAHQECAVFFPALQFY